MRRKVIPLLLSFALLVFACRWGGSTAVPRHAETRPPAPTAAPGEISPPPTPTEPGPGAASPTPPPLSYPIGLEGELANIPAAQAARYDWSQYRQPMR